MPSRERVLLAAFCVTVVALAASSHAVSATPSPKAMVLELSDLPQNFSVEKQGVVSNTQAARESSAPFARGTRFGRVTAYEVEFVRATSATFSNGAAFVVSNATRYRTADGAMSAFRAGCAGIEAEARRARTKLRTLPSSRIGQQSRLYAETKTRDGVTSVTSVAIWRQGPVLSHVVTLSLKRNLDTAQTLALARKQQARIVAAFD